MKKIFVIFVLFPILISFNSYGGWFDKTVCVETDAQDRDGIIYLPNETEPFTGNNLCEYENGQYKSQGKVKDGKKDEEWTEWYENGQIRYEGNYKDGKEDGKWTWWFENGQIEKEVTIKDNTVCVETDVQIRNDIVYLPHETKPFTGKNLCEYENGQVKLQGKIKDGKQDGKWTRWFENGQIDSEVNFKDGILDGKMTWWNENGPIDRDANYKDGKKDGKWTRWYENGQIWWEKNYKDGKQYGKETRWYESGQIKKEKNYKDGECISGDC